MASENSYAQLIDDYEDGIQVIEGETLTEYIKRMGGVEYAHGGGVGSMMQPKKKISVQGGVKNYLGNQKEVKAPLNWQSGPDHPSTELAYITQKEKDLLVKKDLHGSLNGGVNRGPAGIMSLNGWGSTDPGQNVSGAAASAAEGGKNTSDTLAAGMSAKDVQDFRSAAINAGAGQRVNPGFFDSSTHLDADEIARAKEYRNRRDPNTGQLANRFANQAYKNTGQTGIMNMIKRGGFFGNLIRSLGQKFGLGKKAGEASYDMSEFNNLGLGGVDPFANLDIREKFNRKKNVVPNNTYMHDNEAVPPKPYMHDLEAVPPSRFQDNFGYGLYEAPEAPPTGIMKAGGYGGNWGSVPFNPGMGSAPTGLMKPGGFYPENYGSVPFNPSFGNATTSQYPGGEPNLIRANYPGGEPNAIQDFMEKDSGMYSGLPNQKLVNNAAMEVMSNAYKDKYYGGSPFDNPTSVYEAPFGLNYPGGEPRAVVQNDKNPLNEDARFASMPVNSFNSVFNQNTGDPYNDNLYDQEGNYIGLPFARNGGIMGYGRG